MYSVYDLAYEYIKSNCPNICSIGKKNVINSIVEVLNDGANGDDIYQKIKSCKNNNREHYEYFKRIKSGGNLLKPGKIFYHNELRVVPDAPKVYFDINTGEMKRVKQDYFLEMRASYTLDDLYNYIAKKEYLSKSIEDRSRAIGCLRYLTNRYDIDYLLFLIDTVNDIYSSKLKYLRNILDISDYEHEASENYRRRITECAISNTDKVIYKKREL